LHGGGQIAFSAHAPDNVAVDVAIQAMLLLIPQPLDLSTLLPGGLFGETVDATIQGALDTVAAGAKSIGAAAVASLAGLLNGASSVFGGTINVQDEITPTPFRSTSRAFASVAAPATGAFRVTALSLYFGAVGA